VRLLHTSDWHLGRQTYRVSRAPDHDRVLAQILAAARETLPDLILHTGDLWDVHRPAHEDLARGVEALRGLAEVAPVLVLCGNHDSPSLLRVFARLHGEEGRIRFVADARAAAHEFPARDGDVIRVAALPFVHQNRAIAHLEVDPRDWTAAYADRVQRVWRVLARSLADGLDPGRHVTVAAAHLHLEGARWSGSERPLHVTDEYATRPAHLPEAAYAAFGHVHRPQPIPGGRYAGSPLPLDFGEEGEDKSSVLVEARPGRPARVETLPLDPGRPLLSLEGGLAELGAHAALARGALCRVIVDTDEPTPDLAARVADLLPQAVVLEVEERCRGERLEPVSEGRVADEGEAPLRDLFREYLGQEGTRGASAARVLRRFGALLDAAEAEVEPLLDPLERLRRPHPDAVDDALPREGAQLHLLPELPAAR
jgi:exonuclease SbcD